MKLHLYIFPAAGDGNREGFRQAMESFGTIPMQITSMRCDQLYLVGAHYASWFGFIYDNEILSPELAAALPVMLNHEEIDVYVLYRKRVDEKGNKHYTRAPRIFRSHVILDDRLLIPRNPGRLRHEHMLNGWILER